MPTNTKNPQPQASFLQAHVPMSYLSLLCGVVGLILWFMHKTFDYNILAFVASMFALALFGALGVVFGLISVLRDKSKLGIIGLILSAPIALWYGLIFFAGFFVGAGLALTF